MERLDGRERTLRDGTWWELRCPRCLFAMDEWRPRRRPASGGR